MLNHAQYGKQIQENFVYVQVLKASVHMYCVSLVFLAYLRVRVLSFRHFCHDQKTFALIGDLTLFSQNTSALRNS